MTCRDVLLIVGALCEFAGVILVAFPDLLPHATRFSAWLRRRTRPVVDRLRLLVGLPPRQHVLNLSAAAEANAAMRLSVTKGVRAEATLEEQVAFLLERDQEAQRGANTLSRRIDDLEAAVPGQLDELRGQMHAHVERELTAAVEQHRELRVLGAVALALGLACVTVANFV